MTRVAVLDEYWYPQGGGGELATMLYTKRMVESGVNVNIFTNREASGMKGIEALPFGKSDKIKATLIQKDSAVKKKLRKLIPSAEVVYLPSKFLYLAPWIKKENKSAKIIAHLHDYQLVCPVASMYNFLERGACRNINNTVDCMRCTRLFEIANGASQSTALLASGLTLAWRSKGVRLAKTVESVDVFFTVSKRQALIIEQSMGALSRDFSRKNRVLYNPMDPEIQYVGPEFKENVCLGFFGGDRYLKGFRQAIKLTEELSIPSGHEQKVTLLATRVSHPYALQGGKFELRPNLNKAEMQDAFKYVWMVLFLSIAEEPSPYMIMEAQLRGRPILTTDLRGARENIVREGFTGSWFDPEDSDKARSLVDLYTPQLVANPLQRTREISEESSTFFRARSEKSYATFLQAVNS